MAVIIFFVAIITILIVIVIVNSQNQSTGKIENQKKEVELQIKLTPGERPTYKWSCIIAGLNYHKDHVKYGGFLGYGIRRPDNEYDKKAIAIYNLKGGLMGYVPKESQKYYYKEFPEGVDCFVVGYIEPGHVDDFYGKAFFIRSISWEYVYDEIKRFNKWLIEKFGEEYAYKVPDEMFQTLIEKEKKDDGNENPFDSTEYMKNLTVDTPK